MSVRSFLIVVSSLMLLLSLLLVRETALLFQMTLKMEKETLKRSWIREKPQVLFCRSKRDNIKRLFRQNEYEIYLVNGKIEIFSRKESDRFRQIKFDLSECEAEFPLQKTHVKFI